MKVLLLAIGLCMASAVGARTMDGNDLQSGCRVVGRDIGVTAQQGIDGGRCMGLVISLLQAGVYGLLKERWMFCAPEGVTDGQAMKVVLRFLDNHPERLHQPALTLAVVALQEAWPCPKEGR